jgi:hypothetical protein
LRQPRREVDPTARDIFFVDQDVGNINPDAKPDLVAGRDRLVSRFDLALHFNGTTKGSSCAWKFDQDSIAGPLDESPGVPRDGWLEYVPKEHPYPDVGAALILFH